MPWFICSPGEIFLLYCKNLSTRDIFSSLTNTSPGTGGELWVKARITTALPKFRSRQAKFPTPFYTIASAWNCLGAMHSTFLLIAAKSSVLWFPFLLSYAHV